MTVFRSRPWRPAVLSAAIVATCARGAGINTDVALTPPLGGVILRVQFRYSRLFDDPTPQGRVVHRIVQPITLAYGATERLALIGTVPVVYRRVEFGSGGSTSETGIGDIPVRAKFRFYQTDELGKTTRWAAIAGLEIPTFDSAFSSDSVDPIIGTVWTHQEQQWWLDWDLIVKLNTAGGLAGDDEFFADVAWSHRIVGGEGADVEPWGLYGLLELNGRYITDGSVELFGSPGIQFITPDFIVEAGVQLPMVRSMKSPRLSTDYTVILSVRFQF